MIWNDLKWFEMIDWPLISALINDSMWLDRCLHRWRTRESTGGSRRVTNRNRISCATCPSRTGLFRTASSIRITTSNITSNTTSIIRIIRIISSIRRKPSKTSRATADSFRSIWPTHRLFSPTGKNMPICIPPPPPGFSPPPPPPGRPSPLGAAPPTRPTPPCAEVIHHSADATIRGLFSPPSSSPPLPPPFLFLLLLFSIHLGADLKGNNPHRAPSPINSGSNPPIRPINRALPPAILATRVQLRLPGARWGWRRHGIGAGQPTRWGGKWEMLSNESSAAVNMLIIGPRFTILLLPKQTHPPPQRTTTRCLSASNEETSRKFHSTGETKAKDENSNKIGPLRPTPPH